MSDAPSELDPVEKLVDSFLERYRRGERPSLSEYTRQHPELAEQIRELFPALLVVEELGDVGSLAGPPEKRDAASVPLQLGEYRILREMGRGGMGIVYEAVQESLGRHVALKVLPFHGLMNPVHLERFRREARAAARLHHTNIVPVFGVGEHTGIHYYAMQLIHGQGLNEVLHEVKRLRIHRGSSPLQQSLAASVAESLLSGQFSGPALVVPPTRSGQAEEEEASAPLRPPKAARPSCPSSSHLSSQPETRYFRQVAQIGIQVAEALEYSHGEGVLHRDIKPSNLLLDIHGRVWVTDFGLAKTDGTEEVTDPGDIVGTLCYMAPERFQGLADARSDVYGLGITLYEMATLHAAFADTQRAQLINKVTHEEPPRPRKLDRKIPRDLETIILKAIAKEPAQRYPTAAALAEDLRRFVADRPIRARRAPLWERVGRWCRRNPAWAGLSGSVVGLLLVIAVGSLISASLFQKEAGKARQAERAARDKAYKALVAQAQAERWSGRPGRRLDSLQALGEAVELERSLDLDGKELLELRNEAIACLTLTDMRLEKTWEGIPAEHHAVAFDAPLQRYAYSDGQGTIKVCELADGREIFSLDGPAVAAIDLQFSPDGRFLAAGYASQILVWELPERSVRIQLFQTFVGFDWSVDSRQLVVGRQDKSIGVYNLPAGTERKRLAVGLKPLRLAIDPSGFLVAFSAQSHPAVQICELASGRLVAELAAKDLLEPVAWAGDGRFLAAGGMDRNLYVWEVRDEHGRLSVPRPEPMVFSGHESKPITVKFNHAADILASAGWDGTIRLWNPWTGKQLLTAAAAWAFQFSTDDTRLASTLSGGKVGLWRVEGGSVCRALRGRSWRSDQLWGVDFSSDGRLLASAGNQGVRLWDVGLGTELGRVATGQHECVLFQPDNSGLITYGPAGLRRWPIQLHRSLSKTTGPLAVWSTAAPQTLFKPAPPGINTRACFGPDDALLALTDMAKGEALVLNLNPDRRKIRLGPHSNVSFISMSPDGKWVATGPWKGAGIKVWDAREGNQVKEFPADGAANVCFSPDGRWLVAGTTTEYSFWEVGSWRCVHRVPRDRATLPGRMAFSPDGALLAITSSNRNVRLLDPATAEEVATLSSPDSLLISWLCFSRDGSRLAIAAENQGLQVWDLGRIREELAALGLDWLQAAYSPRKSRVDLLPIQLKIQRAEQYRFEAEDLPILEAVNCPAGRQPMTRYGPKRWSNGQQLFGLAAKGGHVTLSIDVPIAANYRLDLFFTKASDFGVVEIALDGEPIGERFDGFNKEVVPSGKISFGSVDLTEGVHELRFTVVDKNGDSSNYFLGIDCLELKPVDLVNSTRRLFFRRRRYTSPRPRVAQRTPGAVPRATLLTPKRTSIFPVPLGFARAVKRAEHPIRLWFRILFHQPMKGFPMFRIPLAAGLKRRFLNSGSGRCLNPLRIRHRGTRQYRSRPVLERLEDRTLPTVVFTPALGEDTLQMTPNNDYNFQTLSSPNVYLIFWGGYWGFNGQQADALAADIQTILNGPLSGALTVYGSDGKASFGGSYVDFLSNPPPGFDPDGYGTSSQTEVQNEINAVINTPGSGILPPPSNGNAIYAVITNAGTGASYSSGGLYTPLGGSPVPMQMISLSFVPDDTAGAALVFSHELLEGMSDPFGSTQPNTNTGVTVQEPPGVTANLDVHHQICDGEATQYLYRLGGPNGLLVAPCWSNAYSSPGNPIIGQGNFVVDDGNSEQVTLQAAPGAWTLNSQGQEVFDGQFDLTIGPTDGTITFDETSAGLQLNINGQSFFFDPGTIVGTTINTGNGSDTVNVEDTVSADTVTINLGSGADIVNISPTAKDLAFFQGNVAITAVEPYILNVNDQNSGLDGVNWQVTGTSVSREFAATINYGNLTNLHINGGSGSNTFDVLGNAGLLNTTINTGGGGNSINVQATTTPLTINSGGPDTINVGDANGVQDIQGQVFVNSTAGPDPDTLNINDTGDRQSRTATITGDSVNLGAAIIEYGPFALSQLNITGDAISGNIFNVKGTAQPLILRDPRTHQIIFEATTTTSIITQAADTINVGGPIGVQGIEGDLVINDTRAPLLADTLNINDQGDTKNKTATITSTAVTGLAPATIGYGLHSLSALNITGDSAAGGNIFNVLSTAPSVTERFGHIFLTFFTTTTINSKAFDTINVGDQNGVQDIQGNLAINAPIPDDTLNINDQGDTSGRTATITDTAVTGLAPATISYGLHALRALNITGDSSVAGNNFNVQSTASPFRFITPFGTIVETTTTTINSKGPDTITVGDSSNHLDEIQGALTVNGQLGGKTALVLDDQGTTANQIYELSASTVQRLTQVNNTYVPNIAQITYSNLANLALHAGSGSSNTLFIYSTSAGTTTNIFGGSDNSQATSTVDEFVVAGGTGGVTLDAILGALNLHGQTASPGGESFVELNDSLTGSKQTYTLTAGSMPNSGEVSRTGIAPITFDGMVVDDLYASEKTSAVINVQSNAANLVTVIAADATGDQVNVGSLAPALGGNMAKVLGTVEVTGNGPATLTVDDSGDASAKTVTTGHVSGNLYSITGLSQGTIEYTSGSVQSLTIYAPSTPENSIDVNGTPTGTALTVHAGFGNITVLSVPDIGGPLTLALGEDNTTYWFDGPATDDNRVYTINSTSVTRTGGFITNIVYPTGFASESFALYTGNPFTDTINVQSSLPHTGWFLDAAPFNPNVFNLGDPVKGLAAVQGEIHVNPEAEPGSPDVETVNLNDQPDNAAQTFTFSFDPNQNLNNVSWDGGGFLAYNNTPPPLANLVVNAGSGNTAFQVKTLPAVSTAITLNGGSGVNTLDYSQYVGNITVDLPLGVATGFSGGINHIENVTGSQGNDLIVGDVNANVLIGGTGRNLIIGGAGGDSITGGGGDNLLIGGTTAYDDNLTALDALFAEWTSSDSLATRMHDILFGGGLNGSYYLNPVATKKLPATVFSDPNDSLFDGTGLSWFFVNSPKEINKGRGPSNPNDVLTHIP